MSGELKGSVAIVTGAARGIGLSVAQELAREGDTFLYPTGPGYHHSGVTNLSSGTDLTHRLGIF